MMRKYKKDFHKNFPKNAELPFIKIVLLKYLQTPIITNSIIAKINLAPQIFLPGFDRAVNRKENKNKLK